MFWASFKRRQTKRFPRYADTEASDRSGFSEGYRRVGYTDHNMLLMRHFIDTGGRPIRNPPAVRCVL
jgi:hypothetical protein